MTTVSATEARKRLYTLIDEVGQSHEPVQITGKRGNAVLLSEDDWRAIQETLELGRNGRMPAHQEFLGEAKVHLLGTYVYSLPRK